MYVCLMPFERREKNLFNYLDNMEKNFFGNSLEIFPPSALTSWIRVTTTSSRLSSPGFNKEDIKINPGGRLPDHPGWSTKRRLRRKRRNTSAKSATMAPLPEALTYPASTQTRLLPTTKTAS